MRMVRSGTGIQPAAGPSQTRRRGQGCSADLAESIDEALTDSCLLCAMLMALILTTRTQTGDRRRREQRPVEV
jgi:hypothetical protein